MMVRSITALSYPQVCTLLKKEGLQLHLFDETAQEVEHGDRRLILGRNQSVRQKEGVRLHDKLAKFHRLVAERNAFVQDAKRAQSEAGLRKLTVWAKVHKLTTFVTLNFNDT